MKQQNLNYIGNRNQDTLTHTTFKDCKCRLCGTFNKLTKRKNIFFSSVEFGCVTILTCKRIPSRP